MAGIKYIAGSLILLTILLAGCSQFGSGSSGSTCIFGANGADVQVQITNSDCTADEQSLATGGQTWYPINALSSPGTPGSADQETLSLICRLTKGNSTMTVMDAGGAIYGDNICSSEEQSGWTQ